MCKAIFWKHYQAINISFIHLSHVLSCGLDSPASCVYSLQLVTADRRPASIFSERELKFMFAICRRPFVCLSVVCLSVTFVRPTQTTEIFGNVSTL